MAFAIGLRSVPIATKPQRNLWWCGHDGSIPTGFTAGAQGHRLIATGFVGFEALASCHWPLKRCQQRWHSPQPLLFRCRCQRCFPGDVRVGAQRCCLLAGCFEKRRWLPAVGWVDHRLRSPRWFIGLGSGLKTQGEPGTCLREATDADGGKYMLQRCLNGGC